MCFKSVVQFPRTTCFLLWRWKASSNLVFQLNCPGMWWVLRVTRVPFSSVQKIQNSLIQQVDHHIFRPDSTTTSWRGPPHVPIFRSLRRWTVMRKLCLIKAVCFRAQHNYHCLSANTWWRSLAVGFGLLSSRQTPFGSRRPQRLRGSPSGSRAVGRSGQCQQGRVTAKASRTWPAAFLWQFPTLHGLTAIPNLASGGCKGYQLSKQESTPERHGKCEQRCTCFSFKSFRTGITTIGIIFCQPRSSGTWMRCL